MSYQGFTATWIAGQEGLFGGENTDLAAPNALVVAKGLTFQNGMWQKEGGAVKFNSTVISGAPEVKAGIDWWPTATIQRQVVYTGDGILFKDDGSGTFSTTLKSGLPTDKNPIFVEGGAEAAGNNRKLFCFIDGNAVQVLSGNGATTSDLATPPTDWATTNQPTFGIPHKGRIWGRGNPNDPNRIYYSMASNHESYTGAGSGSISIFPGEGERLVGGVSWHGRLFLFKDPRGIYWVDDSSTTAADWEAKRLTNTIGCLTQNLIREIQIFTQDGFKDDVVFFSASGGIHLLSAVQELGDAQSGSLSAILSLDRWLRDNLNLSQFAEGKSIWYDDAHELHFGVSGKAITVNNQRLTLDFLRSPPRFRYTNRDTCQAMWVRKDTDKIERPMIGDDVGFTWTLDQSARTKGGAYIGDVQVRESDLSWVDPQLESIDKIFDWMEVHYLATGEWNLSVDVLIDGLLFETITFGMDASKVVQGETQLGSWLLGVSKFGTSTLISRRRRRLRGQGRRFAFRLYNEGDSQDFKIMKVIVGFRTGGAKPEDE